MTLNYDELLSNFAFNFNLRHYTTEAELDWITARADKGGMTSKAGDGKIGRVELLSVVNEWFFMPPDINEAEFEAGPDEQFHLRHDSPINSRNEGLKRC